MSTSKEKLRELCLKEGKSFFQNKNQLKKYIETTLNDYSDCNQLRIITEYDIASKVFTDVTSRDDYKNIKKCVDILVEDYMWKESLANETVDTFVYAKFGNNKVTQTPKEPVKVAPAVVIKETPEDMNQKGVKYSDEEKYVEAVKWFKLAAEQGNADAQYNLGDCYFLGNGVEKDLKEAVKWYKLAAEQGSADVQYDLGDCYYLGNGVEVDYKESLKWYRLSAEQGNADSQNMVGICYYFGRGVEIDYKEAINWFKLAEAQGKIIAKFNIGRCYENGFGVDKNEAEAVKWYKLGAAAGDKNSQEALDNINKSKSAATNTTQVIEKIPTPTVTPDPKKETTVWSVLAYIISLPFKIISAILNVLWTIIVIAIIVLVIISWLF